MSCNQGTRLAKWALLLGVLISAGCASRVMRNSFEGYGEMYAEAENHQLLLNLARLSEHHPTYFFQLGNIQALYEFTGSVSAGGGQSDKSTAFALNVANGNAGPATVARVPFINWLFGPATGTASTSSKPTFQFVPLNGGEFSAHLIVPIRSDVFHALFRDGFPVDILMRALVQEIRFSAPGRTNEMILHNTPAADNIKSYVTFLRLCGVLRELQDHGYLTEKMALTVEPMRSPEIDSSPQAKDVMDAINSGMSWQANRGKWHLERRSEASNNLAFELAPGAEEFLDQLKAKEPYTNTKGTPHGELIDNLKRILSSSSATSNLQAQVEFRSTLFVLAALATEQGAFDNLRKSVASRDLFSAQYIPPSEFRPILKMDVSGETAPLGPALAKVRYQGKEYQIVDCKLPDGSLSTANRDAFLLAATLLTQMSIDPTKLNYQPQLLQVR